MKKALLAVLVVLAVLISGAANARTYEVKKGDKLCIIASKNNVSVTDIMRVNPLIKNADHIKIGWTIEIPDSSTEKKLVKKISAAASPAKKIVANKKVATGTKENPSPYTDDKVNTDPWRGSGVEGLNLLGNNIPEGANISFAFLGEEILPPGALIQMVSGKNKVGWYNVNLSPDKAKVRKLGINIDGERAGFVYQKPECANWLNWSKIPIEEPSIPERGIEEEPPVSSVEPSVETKKPLVLTEKEKFSSWSGIRPELDLDMFAGAGLTHDAVSDTSFWTVDTTLYFLSRDWFGKKGKDQLGVGYIYSASDFRLDDPNFTSHAYRELWKLPSLKSSDYENHREFGLSFLLGEEVTSGHDDEGYKSHGEYEMEGIGGFAKFFDRRAKGEKWFNETQLNFSVLKVIDRDVEHSWRGTPIADTSEMEDFDWAIGAGVRQYIYDFEYLRTFAGLSYAAELPSFYENISLTVGISDKHDIIFAEAGPGVSLMSGDLFTLADAGLDVVEGINFAITKYRESKVRKTIKDKYGDFIVDEENGAVVFIDDKQGAKVSDSIEEEAGAIILK